MTTLTDLVRATAGTADIAAYLDQLPAHRRIQDCRVLPGRLLSKLFDIARGQSTLAISRFADPVEETVVYELKNNLPVFNVSQKRFFRPAKGEVVGYNHTGRLSRLTGPGYFFALDGDDGELMFDYTRLPNLRPPGWPPIKPNTGLVAGATYGNMVDYVRSVSRDTVIGAAYRAGQPRGAYFLLTRAASRS